MDKPKLLDLFCGAGGGAAKGYHEAGFEVIGIDIKPQPRYPYEFHQLDALELLRDRYLRNCFDAIHASPPCQAYANVTLWRGRQTNHPKLIGPTRELLTDIGLPYVIENVRTIALRNPIMVCGSFLGLSIRRHRYFEANWPLPLFNSPCMHRSTDLPFDHGGKARESEYRSAMGCHWMTTHEAREAIPPAYTKYIGRLLFAYLESNILYTFTFPR